MSVIVNSVTMVPIASVTVERSGADEIWRRFVRYDGERCGADDVPVGVSRVKSTADGDLVVVDTVGAVLVRTGGVFGPGPRSPLTRRAARSSRRRPTPSSPLWTGLRPTTTSRSPAFRRRTPSSRSAQRTVPR